MTAVRSRSGQFLQQIYLAWFHGISPSMYYVMGLAATPEIQPMAWLQAGHAGFCRGSFGMKSSCRRSTTKSCSDLLRTSNGLALPTPLSAYSTTARVLRRPTGLEF